MLQSPYARPAVFPPNEHPRLMFREIDRQRIEQNFPVWPQAAALLKETAKEPVTGVGAQPEHSSYHLRQCLAVEAGAFLAWLNSDVSAAERAIRDVLMLLRGFYVSESGAGFAARWGGHVIFTAAEVYDWCYPYLKAEEKNEIIALCEEIAGKTLEMGYPPLKQRAITSHGAEAQLLRDLLAFSVAVYDERPDIYDFCAGRIFAEYVPTYAECFKSGAHSQGPSYGSYRWTFTAWAELIFRAMGVQRVFGNMEAMGEWLFYMTRPDGEAVRLGDDFFETKDEATRRHPFAVPFFYAYALSGRKDFLDQAREQLDRHYLLPEKNGLDYYVGGAFGEGMLSPTSLLIFAGAAPEKPGTALPCCRYFGTPVGLTVFKKGDFYALLKAGEWWFANHDHSDTGCFQIYFHRPLCTESGVYDSYGTPHRTNFLIRTCAHNCLTVERPDKNSFGEWENLAYDGGVRRPGGCWRESNGYRDWLENYRMCKVLEHSEGEDGCKMIVDLSRAYEQTCDKVIRTFSLKETEENFTLTVTDEVTAKDPAYKKIFNVQCQTAPVIGDGFTVTNGEGTVRVEALAPESTSIEPTTLPFETDGVSYLPQNTYAAEVGWGRMKISPREAKKQDTIRVRFTIPKK